MNVKFEGMGVARHLDLVTHNHGSQLGNTPPFPYLSRSARDAGTCKKEVSRVKDECTPTSAENHWTDEYCHGLQVKPGNKITNAEACQELDRLLASIPNELDKQKETTQNQELRKEFNAFKEKAEKFNGRTELTEDERKEAKALIADGQGIQADLNPCALAMKCRLVSYQSTEEEKEVETANPDPNKANQLPGCCPSQTGHHLIPHTMVKNGDCPGYGKDRKEPGCRNAPTVCVEGLSHSHGTHGAMHSETDRAVKIMVGRLDRVGQPRQGENGTMLLTLEQTIHAVANAHAKTFPRSACSKKCIKAQLRGYYGNLKDDKENCCSHGTFAAVDTRNGKLHKQHVRKSAK